MMCRVETPAKVTRRTGAGADRGGGASGSRPQLLKISESAMVSHEVHFIKGQIRIS